jgi:hypothetical protein
MARCREATRSSYPCRRRRHEYARARCAWEGGAWDKAALFSESSKVGSGVQPGPGKSGSYGRRFHIFMKPTSVMDIKHEADSGLIAGPLHHVPVHSPSFQASLIGPQGSNPDHGRDWCLLGRIYIFKKAGRGIAQSRYAV